MQIISCARWKCCIIIYIFLQTMADLATLFDVRINFDRALFIAPLTLLHPGELGHLW